MDSFHPRRRSSDPAKQLEAERNVSTAKDLLAAGKPDRCYQLLIQALVVDPGAPGLDVLLVAATALRAAQRPSGDPDPYAVFGLDPAVPTARDLSFIDSYYCRATDLLNRCHPNDPFWPALTEAARLVADAWNLLSDPDRKASLESAYEALEAAEAAKNAALAAKRQPKRPRSDDVNGNSKEYAIDLEKLDGFSKVHEETNANPVKLSSEKLETTKLAHLIAQETKEEKKLILEAKKVDKESKMLDAYNNLISQDTSSMSDEEKAERVVTMKCLRKALFPETI